MKIAIILGVIILALIAFLFYMGMFKKVSVSESMKGPYTFAFVEHIGPYTGVGKPMAELDQKMRDTGFNSVNGIGIYYDDPKNVAKEDLRSEVGNIISAVDMGKIEANRDKFDFKTIEEANYAVVEFPFHNMLSFMIGPMKAYSALNKYFEDKGQSPETVGIEIYDMENKKIYFLMPLK